MEFFFVFGTFVLLQGFYSGALGINAVQKELVKILEILKNQDQTFSVVTVEGKIDAFELNFFAFTEMPHVVENLENNSKPFKLNSSAIVILDSVKTLEAFNKRTILSATFSLSQQVFIYCQARTVDEISKIKVNRIQLPITMCEYFIVEEQEYFRLLTFVWYSSQKCDDSQLVEVNKFFKSSGRWEHETFRIDKFSNFHGC